MPKSKFSLLKAKDERLIELIKMTDKKILAQWAIDCSERVMPYFEKEYPQDPRPRNALNVLKEWMNTDIFHMQVIRHASLSSHAAAKEIGNDSPAASAAHAAGQAVATAHVKTHSLGPALYGLQAIHRASSDETTDANVLQERQWQYQHLLDLINNH